MKLEYRLEQYRIDAEGNAPIFFWQQDGDYLRSHVELSYTIDTRDAQIFPRKGGKFEVLAGYSGLGGDVHTYNFGVNGSYYWNLRGDTIFQHQCRFLGQYQSKLTVFTLSVKTFITNQLMCVGSYKSKIILVHLNENTIHHRT